MIFRPKFSSEKTKTAGYLVVLLLVFGAIFFTIFSAFMGFVTTGKRLADHKLHSEQAMQIAEAGLNYYKWFLSHNPEDIQNGTTTPGPYVMSFSDPEGGQIGEYSLAIDGNLSCGEVTSIDITSTGYTEEEPGITRTVFARYALPNVAEYSHIVNSNVWAGPDRQIFGPYHSNGFVRMDGTNNSKVTSGQTLSDCGLVDVCNSPYPSGYNSSTDVNGVFGAGTGSDLWEWGVPPVNFTSITVDLSVMADKAKNGGGDWYGDSTEQGYYVVFNSDGTYTLRRVRGSKAKGNAYGHAKNFLNSAQLIGTYAVPSGCAVLYFEDDVWVEGTVRGKVTLAAADVDTSGVDPKITLIGNLNYANSTSGVLMVAEDDVLVGLDVPNDMTISGIFIAQNGQFSRPHYTTGSCGSTTPCVEIQNGMSGDIFKNSLTTNGTVVSNGRVGTKWMSGTTWVSGFNQRYDYYDRDQAIDPPPLTPKTSDNYQFIEWREVN